MDPDILIDAIITVRETAKSPEEAERGVQRVREAFRKVTGQEESPGKLKVNEETVVPPSPFRGDKGYNYKALRKGTCRQGQRADLTGCTPASGEGEAAPRKVNKTTSERKPKRKQPAETSERKVSPPALKPSKLGENRRQAGGNTSQETTVEQVFDVSGDNPSDPAYGRPSTPEERKEVKPTSKGTARQFPPPPPKKASKAPGQGYAANGMTNTAFGNMGEAVTSLLNLRSVLPPGQRSHKPGEVKTKGSTIDREWDHSGWLFEVKSVCVEGNEYKAAPQKHEVAAKLNYAEIHQCKPGTIINVVDTDNGRAYVYWKEGISSYAAITSNTLDDWNFAGVVEFEPPKRPEELQGKGLKMANLPKGRNPEDNPPSFLEPGQRPLYENGSVAGNASETFHEHYRKQGYKVAGAKKRAGRTERETAKGRFDDDTSPSDPLLREDAEKSFKQLRSEIRWRVKMSDGKQEETPAPPRKRSTVPPTPKQVHEAVETETGSNGGKYDRGTGEIHYHPDWKRGPYRASVEEHPIGNYRHTEGNPIDETKIDPTPYQQNKTPHPPVALVDSDEGVRLIDGHHRHLSAQKAGYTHMHAVVYRPVDGKTPSAGDAE